MSIPRSDSRSLPVDRVTRLRRRVLPTLHRIKEPLGGFAVCTLDPAEYVGTVPRPLDDVREALRRMEFEREPIASLKRRSDGRLSAGSWARRESPLAEKQLHVTLIRDAPGTVELFAHREYSWLTHPYRHYTFDGWEPEAGAERMRDLLAEHDVPLRIE
ncbi:hypothetical protein SAMN06269185_0235 [Natronoarchaeum philippinense]|uniref:Uncharacterized protein n=1 Tax=Natronoarchaeum philippinense TaxID=558529 RepID=A0A285N5J7_NATPI|nr:hypothetical protein [Natronoarchaeum philippinense]SNZ03276.1 hypothetical protein SAMN06269185_0235 [Natronoarchaeum philippinense]